VVEADDRPRDHVPDNDDNKTEQIFQNVAVPQQNPLRLSRLELGQDPASITVKVSALLRDHPVQVPLTSPTAWNMEYSAVSTSTCRLKITFVSRVCTLHCGA